LVFSGSRDPKPALPILTEWLRANTPSAVLSGPIGGGRTTLLRTWLVDVARDALLRDGLPVRYVDGAEWRAQGHISALLADLSPNQLAALRLAITTGNCLLVVDGIDDILPKKLLTHDFVDRWLGESSTTRLLQTSCWPESPSLLLSLQRDKAQPTRSPPDVLAERMENTLRRVMADQPIPPVHTHDPADLLDDLALALWSATPIATPGAPSRITETALRRHRAPKRSHGSERDPALQHLERMHQSVIAIDSNNQTPQNTNLTQVWQWHAQHAALRAPLPPSVARNTLEKTWITLQWDSLLHHLLSRQIVRALIAGETAPLDILPLHSTTVEYCRNHPDWPQAWPKLARILTRPPAKDISVNALILAVKATPLASTSEQPWRLDGLDLRALDLTSARLDHASFNNTLLTRSQLGGASLRCADLTQTKLDACNLTGANLTEVRASGASFAGAHLEGTQLHSADLQNADLSRTFFLGQPPDYSAAQLSGAMLCAVDWPSNPLSPEQQAEATWRWSTNRITPDRIDECLRTPLLHHVSLAWSPDGHIIAAGDTAGRLTLWSSGPIIHCLALINAHSGPLHSVAFSPDGATIATVGSDQHVRLWRSEDLAVTREYSLQTPVSGLFWRDDRHLWIFGDSTFLWDLSADTPPSRQPWISQAEAGAITHDGRHLVTVRRHENKKRFEVYDTATQSHVALHSSDSGWLSSVDLAKGRLLVDDRGLYIRSLVETSSGRLLVTPNERIDRHMLSHDRPTESWIRDGQRLLILAEHGACFAFDTQSLARQALILPFFLSCILVTADEERLLLASGATFKTTHIGLEPLYAPPDPDLLNINHVEWTRSTLHLRSPNLDLRLDLALGSIERLPSTHYKRPSPDGSRSIDREGDGFSIWDRATQRRTLLDPYPIYNEILQDLDFLWSLDAQKVAVQRSTPSSNSTDTTIWNATTGKQIFQGELPGGGSILLVTKAGISLLVERDRGAWFHLLDLDRDTLLTVKTSPNGSICRVHASQGLRYLAFTTAQSTRVIQSDQLCRALADIPDRSSSVIDLPETATTIAAHPPSHSACAIDEDRGCVAIVAGDTLDVHQIHDGQLLAKIRLDSRPTSLAFSADGEHIMVHYHDHLQFWRLGTPALLARVYLEMSGALVLSNGRFQRLSAANAAQPSLCGFYARSGVQLHPLDRLAHLESKTLCADLWKTLTSTAGARQDAPKE
jgi:hypothetical protein